MNMYPKVPKIIMQSSKIIILNKDKIISFNINSLLILKFCLLNKQPFQKLNF